MTETREELLGLIDKLVTKETFTLEAVKQISELRDKATELSETLEKKRERYRCAQKSADEFRRLSDSQAAQIAGLNKKIGELEVRIAEMSEDNTKRQVAEARAEAFKHSMETVFRPASVRKVVHSNVPVTRDWGHGSGNTVEYYSHTEDSTETDE